MIKVTKNSVRREPIPAFLRGLSSVSLLDLSWTDPNLGVHDAAWWPEEDQSPPLGEFERYGAEALTPDYDRKVVIVTRAVEPWSEEEIKEYKRSLIPSSVTMRQARLALMAAGVLEQIDAAIDSLPEPDQSAARIEWEYSQEVERDRPFVQMLGRSLNLSEDEIDDLFITASQL